MAKIVQYFIFLCAVSCGFAFAQNSSRESKLNCSFLLISDTQSPQGLACLMRNEFVSVEIPANYLPDPVDLSRAGNTLSFFEGAAGTEVPKLEEGEAPPVPWMRIERPEEAGDYLLLVADSGERRQGQWVDLNQFPVGTVACVNLTQGPARVVFDSNNTVIAPGQIEVKELPEGREGFASVPVNIEVLENNQPVGIYSGFWPGRSQRRVILIIRSGLQGGTPIPIVIEAPVVSEEE